MNRQEISYIFGITSFIMIAIVLGVLASTQSNSSDSSYNTQSYSSQSHSPSPYNTSSNDSNQDFSEATYKEFVRAGEEFEKACAIYNSELNLIPDKATSGAYSGLNAQKVFWDCDDAFQLVEKKGAAFARALRKCGQEENARELERRLKADRRKYQSYKDEVNHMLGIY